MSLEREGLRAEVERLLEPNGIAGEVEVEEGPYGDPDPVCQYFAAQAGPFDDDTRVTVLGPREREKLLALLREQEPEPRGLGIRQAHEALDALGVPRAELDEEGSVERVFRVAERIKLFWPRASSVGGSDGLIPQPTPLPTPAGDPRLPRPGREL